MRDADNQVGWHVEMLLPGGWKEQGSVPFGTKEEATLIANELNEYGSRYGIEFRAYPALKEKTK